MKLQLKRSSTLVSGEAKRPLDSQLAYGELAVNYHANDPKIFLKDSSNNVVSITDAYLELAGGTLTGDLTLSGDPTSALMPATKQYTDNAITTLSNSIVYPVTSVNTYTGSVSLNYSDVGAPSVTGTNATGSWGISITGNSATTTKWATARTITFSGDVTGSVSINGASNKTVTMTVVDDSHNHVISNVDGLQTALNAKQDAGSAIANSLALNGKADTQFVQTANNSTLNSDTRNTRGPTRLFRRDQNSDYSVQTDWTGTYWRLRGYNGDTFHAECQVSYADSAGSTTSATNATNATNINVAADNSGNSNHYVIFTDSATGNQRPKSDTSLKYNSSTNTLTVSNFAGTATNATNFNVAADNSTNSNHYVIFTNGTTGNQRPNSDSALKYNPSSNTLTVGTVNGALSGNASTATTATNATNATNFNVAADNSTNSNHYLIFTGGTTGNQRPNSDSALQYNPSTNKLIAGRLQCRLKYSNDYYFWLENNFWNGIGGIHLAHSGNTYAFIKYDSSDNVGFSGTSITHPWLFKCDNSGNVTATGDVTAYSDRSLKTDIQPIKEALNKVDQINGVTFKRVDMNEGRRQAGVIAQDVQKVLPEVVSEGDDGKLTLAYGNIVGLLVEAIKELRQEVKELKGE